MAVRELRSLCDEMMLPCRKDHIWNPISASFDVILVRYNKILDVLYESIRDIPDVWGKIVIAASLDLVHNTQSMEWYPTQRKLIHKYTEEGHHGMVCMIQMRTLVDRRDPSHEEIQCFIQYRRKFCVKVDEILRQFDRNSNCLLYTSPSPRDGLLSRMPSSA